MATPVVTITPDPEPVITITPDPEPPRQYLPGRAFGMDVARGMGLDADKIAAAEDAEGQLGGLKEIGSQVLEGIKGTLKDPFNIVKGPAGNFEEAVKSGSPGKIVGALSTILGGAETAEKVPEAAGAARGAIGNAIHTPEGELTPGAQVGSQLAGGGVGTAVGSVVGHPYVGGVLGYKAGPFLLNKAFPESAETVAARQDFLQAKTITEAQEAAIAKNAVIDARKARVAAQQAKADAARNAAPTYAPPAHTEVPLGSPEYPGPNLPIPQRLTAAQQEFLRQGPAKLSDLATQVPSKGGSSLYGPESAPPPINKTYVSYPGDMLVELAKKGDLNAVRELIRNPRGININNIPGVRYLIEQGRQGAVYGGSTE